MCVYTCARLRENVCVTEYVTVYVRHQEREKTCNCMSLFVYVCGVLLWGNAMLWLHDDSNDCAKAISLLEIV